MRAAKQCWECTAIMHIGIDECGSVQVTGMHKRVRASVCVYMCVHERVCSKV